MSTTPTPCGYHSIQPYLVVRGAAKAIDFYHDLFGATETLRMPNPATGKLMHAEIRIGDSVVMLSDESADWGVHSAEKYGGSPVSLMHYCADVDAIFAKATSAGCTVLLPPADMFWGDRMCKFVDPFGHVWGVATHKFDPTPEQLAEGAKAFAG